MGPGHITARPTLYNGTRFRSRLEARWAAFFDQAGWRWEYEPLDLRGWVPDFLLIGRMRTIPVEVKPILWDPSGRVPPGDEAFGLPELEKARTTGHEVLILGAYLPTYRGFGSATLGALMNEEWTIDEDGGGPDTAILWAGHQQPLDFSANQGSYRYRVGGEYDGDRHLRWCGADEVTEFWREAGNRTQWTGLGRH